MQLLRKVDRAGILYLGKRGQEGIGAMLGTEWNGISVALEILLKDGCVTIANNALVIRNFMAAQETPSSDAQRQRRQREKAKYVVLNGSDVTESHTPSHGVTDCHTASLCTVLNCTVPNCKPNKKREKVSINEETKQVAEQVLKQLNEARKRVIANCRDLGPVGANIKHIADRLSDGNTLADCEHVIAVAEADVRKDPKATKWMQPVTMFRPDNFARKLGMTAKAPQRVDSAYEEIKRKEAEHQARLIAEGK